MTKQEHFIKLLEILSENDSPEKRASLIHYAIQKTGESHYFRGLKTEVLYQVAVDFIREYDKYGIAPKEWDRAPKFR